MSTADQTPRLSNKATFKVTGMHCANCALRIADTLNAEKGVEAEVSLATERLSLAWEGEAARAATLLEKAKALGYDFLPEGDDAAEQKAEREKRFLTLCLALAGIGLALALVTPALPFSLPPFLKAGLLLPLALVASLPFFKHALKALLQKQSDMDKPISLAIVLTLALGASQLLTKSAPHAFDSVLMLLFLLLLGRLLEAKTRQKARRAAQSLLSFFSGTATLVREDGSTASLPVSLIRPGVTLLVAAGEKIPVDGEVLEGISEADPSFITGETQTQPLGKGDQVYGGLVNLLAPVKIKALRGAQDSLPGEVLKLMEKAQQSHAHYVRIAARAAKLYTPFVFLTALFGFLLWWLALGSSASTALNIAASVLVITCPCALGLAVPAVQMIASGTLFKKGILLKTGDALERLAEVDTILFDKTGTLTEGTPRLLNPDAVSRPILAAAARLASGSKHPLARALKAAALEAGLAEETLSMPEGAREKPGFGMEATVEGRLQRLGRRDWCGDPSAPANASPELWFDDGEQRTCFIFEDKMRPETEQTIETLKRQGYRLELLSGDRSAVVLPLAKKLGFEEALAECTPIDKAAEIEDLKTKGAKILMVGDGLNDAAALALADVSLSPSSALDIAQNAASLVFQGKSLSAVTTSLALAKKATRLVKQNFGLALIYNVLAVPLALFGLVTPSLAAAAMALSSIVVILNALRAAHI